MSQKRIELNVMGLPAHDFTQMNTAKAVTKSPAKIVRRCSPEVPLTRSAIAVMLLPRCRTLSWKENPAPPRLLAPGSVSISSLHVEPDLQQHVARRRLAVCEVDRTEPALGVELVDHGDHSDVASLAAMPVSVPED